MMYQDVVRSRRSVRDFMPDVEIPKEELMAIIEEAMFAPNSTNLNSWRFLRGPLRSFDATTSS